MEGARTMGETGVDSRRMMQYRRDVYQMAPMVSVLASVSISGITTTCPLPV